MAEWLIESGIGETRAVLIENGEVLAARLNWPGEIRAGALYPARLVSRHKGSRRGIAALETGRQVLVDHLPDSLTEGSSFSLRISRAAIAERGRFKHAQGRHCEDAVPEKEADPSSNTLQGRVVPAFEASVWEDIWHAASSGSLDFAGGQILCSVTPAMTVIDVDGTGSARDLSINAIPAISRALHWFGVAGNIGIDFPTLETKADRRAVDTALAGALDGWAHERTAMNGFGFVQLVARLEGPSLLHRFATSRVGLCARFALRAGERAKGVGAVLILVVHPALKAKMKPEWIAELARRTGRQVRIETDPGLALEAPYAQILNS